MFPNYYDSLSVGYAERQRIKAVLDSLTYKPGWRFSLDGGPSYQGVILVRVEADTVDVNPPHGRNTLVSTFSIHTLPPEYAEGRLLYQQIQYGIWQMERHESDEWIKFDGVRVFDPHKKGI